MLALTQDATEAIEEILAAPEMPDGAGVRITRAASGDTAAAFQMGLAEAPEAGDAVVEAAGARVFMQDTTVDLLEDRVLDADRSGDEIRFSLVPAA